MKRLTIFGFIACVGLMLAPVVVNSDPAGPPGGLAVKVVSPLPLPVTGNVGSSGTPLQLFLLGLFNEGDVNLRDSPILGPRSYTIPEGFSTLLIKHVSCRAITGSGQKVQIFLESQFDFPGFSTPGNLIEMIPDNEIYGALPQPRQVAHANVHAYLGISTPGGPTIGDTLLLQAQRDATTGTGSVRCVVSGELQQ